MNMMRPILGRSGTVQRCATLSRSSFVKAAQVFRTSQLAPVTRQHRITRSVYGDQGLPWRPYSHVREPHVPWPTTAETILDLLKWYKLPHWGFVLYRCTYRDDDDWRRFMTIMNSRLKSCFESDKKGQQAVALHKWTIQVDPGFDGALKEDVREHFRAWTATEGAKEYSSCTDYDDIGILQHVPRYSFCIAVDEDSLQSVLAREDHQHLSEKAYVNITRADAAWYQYDRPPKWASFDWSTYVPPDPDDDENFWRRYDEDEIELEGCRLHDVGWLKCNVDFALSSLWGRLSCEPYVWEDQLYVRPTEGIGPRY